MSLNIDFRLADNWKMEIEETIKAINSDGLPLVLFGNIFFPAVSRFLQNLHVDISYICDNNPEKRKYSFYDCKAIAPADLNKLFQTKKYNVFILPKIYENEISEQLKNLKSSPNHIYCLDLYYYNSDPNFIYENMDKIKKVYNLLADDLSRDTYQATINYRISRNIDFIKLFAKPTVEQYFDSDIISLNDTETFFDGGAFVGDTIAEFIKQSKGKYKDVYAFEPERENYLKLESFSQQYKNIHTFQIGLSDNTNIGRINSLGMGSSIGEMGDETVKVDSIDNILSQVDHPDATFIKMDIEGFECKALKGASNTIHKFKPKLAICMYHSIEDMMNVPLLIHEIEPGYSLYIRHYSHGIAETVCYAVYNR